MYDSRVSPSGWPLIRLFINITFRGTLSVAMLLWLVSQFYQVSVNLPHGITHRRMEAHTSPSSIYVHWIAYRRLVGHHQFYIGVNDIDLGANHRPIGNYSSVFQIPGIEAVWHDPLTDFSDQPRTFTTIYHWALCFYISLLYAIYLVVVRWCIGRSNTQCS